MAQGGEFAFVLYAAAVAVNIIDARQNAVLTAIVILSMVLTPVLVAAMRRIPGRRAPSTEGYERPHGMTNIALVIGFGRVGQIASQFLFARGYEISIIDTDTEMIDVARELNYEVYYGDGTRLDILQASGVADARVVLVCVDKPEDASGIANLMRSEFPDVPVIARAIDRRNSLDLIRAGVAIDLRETFESALVMGAAALERPGASQAEITRIESMVRERDSRRMALEVAGGIDAGRALFRRVTTRAREEGESD